jgi:hypothetical protein
LKIKKTISVLFFEKKLVGKSKLKKEQTWYSVKNVETSSSGLNTISVNTISTYLNSSEDEEFFENHEDVRENILEAFKQCMENLKDSDLRSDGNSNI